MVVDWRPTGQYVLTGNPPEGLENIAGRLGDQVWNRDEWGGRLGFAMAPRPRVINDRLDALMCRTAPDVVVTSDDADAYHCARILRAELLHAW